MSLQLSVVVPCYNEHSASTALELNAIKFFSENERFAELFTHYTRIDKMSRYTSYIKDSAWQPARPAGCREIF